MTKRLRRFGERSSGVLMHITSLPGPYGAGDLGRSSRQFLEVLRQAKQSYWQMLPVSPIGKGFSPYASDSAFAGEARLVGPDELFRDGLITRRELKEAELPATSSVDYKRLFRKKEQLLQSAFESAKKKGILKRAPFQNFMEQEKKWLHDFCLYRVLSFKHRNEDWSTWSPEYRDRNPAALRKIAEEERDDMERVAFAQHLFNVGWARLRREARLRGVGLIGDLPIFVSHESADCWAHAHLFHLNKRGKPKVVSGCPPDPFAKNGQLWGHALYNWSAMEQNKFRWWIARFERSLRQFDAIRLDHFIGFYRYWSVPADAKTARGGRWVRAKGDELFTQARRKLGPLPFVAEDLGPVIPPVRTLRDKHRFAGMKLMQFGFDDSKEALHHRPHLLPINSVIYPGTHDNDTARGWFKSLQKQAKSNPKSAGGKAAHRAASYLGNPDEKRAAMEMIKASHQSIAHTSIIPAQDILGLDSQARMNVPGSETGNWKWRMLAKDANHAAWDWFGDLTQATDRV